MSRYCERPGCSTSASIAYGIDQDHLTVVLDVLDPADTEEHRPGVLCRRHADAMVVPLGWMLDDRRDVVPRLFRVGHGDPRGALRQRRRAPSASPDAGQQLELDGTSPDSGEPLERLQKLLDDPSGPVAVPALTAVATGERQPDLDVLIDADHPSMEPEPEHEPDSIEPDEIAGDEPCDPATATPSPAGEPASAWTPVFDETDDLDGLLSARSPLLARAFGGGGGGGGASNGKPGRRRPERTRG